MSTTLDTPFNKLLMVDLEKIAKMEKTLKGDVRVITRQQVLGLLNAYYSIQEYRKAMANQILPKKKTKIKDGEGIEETDEQVERRVEIAKARRSTVLSYVLEQLTCVEIQIQKALEIYAQEQSQVVGR